MPMLANGYIPFVPIVPLFQVLLLVGVILIEGIILKKEWAKTKTATKFWMGISLANIMTSLIGIALAFLFVFVEASLLFGWGSQKHIHPNLWYMSCVLFLVLPWGIWFLCYVISWRFEAYFLKRWLCISDEDMHEFRKKTIFAHRITYGVLAIPLVLAGLWYLTFTNLLPDLLRIIYRH